MVLKMRHRTLIKINTVGATSHEVKSAWVQSKIKNRKAVPLIRISGLWLYENGFEIGAKYEIYQWKNQLLLKAVIEKGDSSPVSTRNKMVKDSSITMNVEKKR
jgi:hypothetical protein